MTGPEHALFKAPYFEKAEAHAQSIASLLTEQRTLTEVLQFRGEKTEGRDVHFIHLDQYGLDPYGPELGEDDSQTYSYKGVLEAAQAAADFLLQHGVSQGHKVLIILPTGPAFMSTFLGCQLIGAVPVPSVPPYSMNRLDEYICRVASLAHISEATCLVTSSDLKPVFQAGRSQGPGRGALSNMITDKELLRHKTRLTLITETKPDDTAMIQFTSGSTGTQKGVVLTHANLLANIRAIGEGAMFVPGDVCTMWLPLYHDMGLIGHFLAAIVWGMPLVMMPPQHFIRRPSSWLKAITKHRGSCCAAPNFAYSLCVKKVRGEVLKQLDLSSWRVAFCGAEPIDPVTVEAFIDKFEGVGFKRGTFFPVYGMAENSLAVTFPPPGRGPLYDAIDRKVFEATGVAKQVERGAEGSQLNISCGRALPGHEIRVCSEEGQVQEQARLGEIEIRGPSRMVGYYKNEEATQAVIRDGGWLKTGDLGYIRNGELFVTGRRKEMIIKGGRNYFPQDIEGAAGRVDGIRTGCCAAFGLWNSPRGTEDLILVCETRLTGPAQDELLPVLRSELREQVGISPDRIILVPPGSVPKTSSGKIQRRLCRKRYLEGDLTPGRKPFMTLARVYAYQLLGKLQRIGQNLLPKPRKDSKDED